MTFFRFRFQPHPDEWTQQVQQATDRLMQRLPQVGEVLGRAGTTLAQDEAPKDTGRYAASHGHEIQRLPGGIRIRVGPGVSGQGFAMFGGRDTRSLALWITSGTRPHVIRGNPWLAFYVAGGGGFSVDRYGRGGLVITRSVNHPGTKPNDYMARMFRRWQPRVERTFQRLAEDWIQDIG